MDKWIPFALYAIVGAGVLVTLVFALPLLAGLLYFLYRVSSM